MGNTRTEAMAKPVDGRNGAAPKELIPPKSTDHQDMDLNIMECRGHSIKFRPCGPTAVLSMWSGTTRRRCRGCTCFVEEFGAAPGQGPSKESLFIREMYHIW